MLGKSLLVLSLALATTLTLGAGRVAGQLVAPLASQEEVPLLELMEGMKSHLKGTAMALGDPSRKEDALAHVAELQRYLLLAKLRTPANLEELPEELRAEHRTAFRRDMAQALKVLVDLEVHILDGQNEEAFKLVTGDLFALRKQAHAKYQQEE